MKDSLENAISMLVRVQEKFAKDNVGLRFHMTWEPVMKDKPKPDPELPKRKRTSVRR